MYGPLIYVAQLDIEGARDKPNASVMYKAFKRRGYSDMWAGRMIQSFSNNPLELALASIIIPKKGNWVT